MKATDLQQALYNVCGWPPPPRRSVQHADESLASWWATAPRRLDPPHPTLWALNCCVRGFDGDTCPCGGCRTRRTNAQVAQALRDWQATP
jgi:hypothetical protein